MKWHWQGLLYFDIFLSILVLYNLNVINIMKKVNCIGRQLEYLEKGAIELFPTINDLIPSILAY